MSDQKMLKLEECQHLKKREHRAKVKNLSENLNFPLTVKMFKPTKNIIQKRFALKLCLKEDNPRTRYAEFGYLKENEWGHFINRSYNIRVPYHWKKGYKPNI